MPNTQQDATEVTLQSDGDEKSVHSQQAFTTDIFTWQSTSAVRYLYLLAGHVPFFVIEAGCLRLRGVGKAAWSIATEEVEARKHFGRSTAKNKLNKIKAELKAAAPGKPVRVGGLCLRLCKCKPGRPRVFSVGTSAFNSPPSGEKVEEENGGDGQDVGTSEPLSYSPSPPCPPGFELNTPSTQGLVEDAHGWSPGAEPGRTSILPHLNRTPHLPHFSYPDLLLLRGGDSACEAPEALIRRVLCQHKTTGSILGNSKQDWAIYALV
jgi:hypothetical protein